MPLKIIELLKDKNGRSSLPEDGDRALFFSLKCAFISVGCRPNIAAA